MTNAVLRLYLGLFDRPAGEHYSDRLRRDHDRASVASRTAADHRRAHQESLREGLDGCPYCA